jgi:hypothetical protein
MAVRYIDYNGEKLPLKADFRALRDTEAETGVNVIKLKENEDLNLDQLTAFFFYAYVSGCLATRDIGFSVKYDREQAGEIMNEVYLDFVEEFPLLIRDMFETHLQKKKLKAAPKQTTKRKPKKTSSQS